MLPTINSNLGVSFPLSMSGWVSVSYPVDVLISFVTRLVPRRPTGPKRKQIRAARRKSVERLGMSIACRYTPTRGFQFRVTPWLFLFPGIQLIAQILAKLVIAILGQMEQLEAQTYQNRQEWRQRHQHPQLYSNSSSTSSPMEKAVGPSETNLAVRRYKVRRTT